MDEHEPTIDEVLTSLNTGKRLRAVMDETSDERIQELLGAITKFGETDPVETLRLCASCIEDEWHPEITHLMVSQRSIVEWLRKFASHLEEAR